MDRLIAADLALRRGGRRVLVGVGFDLAAGEALAVTGRNGAGKSSLLAVLAGRLPPDRGTIRAEGVGAREVAECLHLVGHRDALKGALTAAENLRFARDLLGEGPPGGPGALAPEDALGRLDIPGAADLPAGVLSAGQRRRVALARLLVAPRPLWLLDEPLAALDRAGEALLGDLLAGHLAAGGLVVAATHAALPGVAARGLALVPPVRAAADGAEDLDAWA